MALHADSLAGIPHASDKNYVLSHAAHLLNRLRYSLYFLGLQRRAQGKDSHVTTWFVGQCFCTAVRGLPLLHNL